MTLTLAVQLGAMFANLVTIGFIILAEVYRQRLARIRQADLEAVVRVLKALIEGKTEIAAEEYSKRFGSLPYDAAAHAAYYH